MWYNEPRTWHSYGADLQLGQTPQFLYCKEEHFDSSVYNVPVRGLPPVVLWKPVCFIL